ncbi:hypothetical protein [Caballeronia cordobensis]|uniref:hypothetical protein n=1 Tax=Caballeronia cordobensis TaxID=1353886 RepID=UPI00045EFCF6|nr:uncharacterized protein BRPE67_CCDS11230 [Burkholderia sp. RPE67]
MNRATTNAASRRTIDDIEDLFAWMGRLYGARFDDFWKSSAEEPAMLKAQWLEGFVTANVTDAGIKRAKAALFREKAVPTLPRFIELCMIEPMYVALSVPVLTREHRVTPVGLTERAKIDAILAKHNLPKREPGAGTDGIKWAFKILREANENDVPLNKLAIAQQAIADWCASHGCSRSDLDENGDWTNTPHARQIDEVAFPPRVPSPHIVGDGQTHVERAREPGNDDEDIAA